MGKPPGIEISSSAIAYQIRGATGKLSSLKGFKKAPRTFAGTARRVLRTKEPDPFLTPPKQRITPITDDHGSSH
jgi:hypothetical protein